MRILLKLVVKHCQKLYVILGHLPIVTQVKRDTFLYHLRSKGTPSYTISGQKGHLPCSVSPAPQMCHLSLNVTYIRKLSLRMEKYLHTHQVLLSDDAAKSAVLKVKLAGFWEALGVDNMP